jgi:signal transduction histidine kinase
MTATNEQTANLPLNGIAAIHELSQFLEGVPVGVFIALPGGRPYYANKESARLLGRGVLPSETGDTLAEAYQVYVAGTDDHYPGERLPVVRALAGETLHADDLDIHAPDGTTVPVEVWATPVLGATGSIEYGIALFVDISERRRIEAALASHVALLELARDELARRAIELEQANSQLGRSNEELEQFAYIASHDLAEPLRAISGPISLLGRRYHDQLDAEADQFIDFAVDGCRRMQAMIDDLLAFSRAGRGEGQVEAVDCNLLLHSVTAALAPRIAETRAVLRLDPLPTVVAQPLQLGQVFQNLTSNALKFVAPGVIPEVAVSAERVEGDWRFSVTDNGVGIEPRHRERVFGMFKRLHTRAEYAGSGIGLALCKRIVERNGGHIGVEDAPVGAGTRFWFTLPISQFTLPTSQEETS